MKLLTYALIRILIALVIALTLMVSLVSINGSTSYAATLSSTHAKISDVSASPLRPLTSSIWIGGVNIHSNTNVTYTIHWAGAGLFSQEIDFSTDEYTCNLNCSSGETSFNITYPRGTTDVTEQAVLYNCELLLCNATASDYITIQL